jgi:hypothetical protein
MPVATNIALATFVGAAFVATIIVQGIVVATGFCSIPRT